MTNTELLARLALTIRDQAQSQQIADELSEFGFRINSVTPRGVMFSGAAALFEKNFNTKVTVTKAGARFAAPPEFPERFKQMVDSVYFPTKPTFFNGRRRP